MAHEPGHVEGVEWWNPQPGYQNLWGDGTSAPGEGLSSLTGAQGAGPTGIDQRIGELTSIYGDYADALQGAQVNFDPYQAQYNQYFGAPSGMSPGGGQYGGVPYGATGQYAPIEQALSDAGTFFGDQEGRYGTFYDERQGRYQDLATQFLDMAQGEVDAEGNRTGGFYNRQYENAIAALDAQYAGALSGANSLYDLGMGVVGPDGVRTGGFFADQYTDALGTAGGLRDLLTGQIDERTGMAMGGLYGTQYNMDTALNEALYGAWDEASGQYTGGTQRQMMEGLYGEGGASQTMADTIYDRAAGTLGEDEIRTGGYYAEAAQTAVTAAQNAYQSAAAEVVRTGETRPVMDAAGEPVMQQSVDADGLPAVDEAGEPVMVPVTEEVFSYQGGFYGVQEAEQIRRAEIARAQANAHAASVKAEQVRVANQLFNTANAFFTDERDAALGMLQAMEGVEGGSEGVRGRYTQQMSFFGAQEQRGIAELARQIGVINAENLRRSGRVSEYETLMVGQPDPVTGQRTQTGAAGGRIGAAEQAMLERIGGLQAGAAQEMGTVRAAEEQRLADLRTGYGEDVSGAVAALQAQGIDPTQLQAMTAQTGALLGAQEASQLAMLDRLQRAEGMLGSEQTLAAQQMADEARRALENQLFSARTGIEEDIYGRLEGVEQRKFGVAEGARGGEFQAGQTQSAALDALSREVYGVGAEARRGVFGAGQEQASALSSAGLGELQRRFDAMQREGATIGTAQDVARAGIFGASQQQAQAIAAANAMRDAGLFQAENVYETAMGQARSNLVAGLGGLDESLLTGAAAAQGGLLAGTTQAQVSYQQAVADALAAQGLGGFQSGYDWRTTMGDAYGQQLAGYGDAYAQQEAGYFDAGNQYYQNVFDAIEAQQAGTFQAEEDAATGLFGAGQQADADIRALEAQQFDTTMDLSMREALQTAGLQGDLAQSGLTRDMAIAEATADAAAAAASGVDVMEAWMTPGSATQEALSALGYTPDQVANFDNTTLRGLVNQYWDRVHSEVDYAQTHVTSQLPWQGDVLYNQATGEYGSMGDYPGAGFPGGAITGLEQAANAGFAPYQEPVTYTDAQYAAGDMPGSFGYEAPSQPLLANVGGMNFNIGTVDAQGNPQISDWRALEMWASAQGNPMPQRDAYQTDEQGYQDSLSLWWAAILPALQTLASP